MIGGWSPGPLIYLRRFLSAYTIVQPRNLPMPPIPGSWCCDVKVLLMAVVLGFLLWASCRLHEYLPGGIIWNLLAIVATFIWFRYLAAIVVRVSIRKSVQICLDSIRQHDNVIIIGFSWGGAVVAEMLASGMLGDVPRGVIMIAPTTSLVAKIAMEEDAALRIAASHSHYESDGSENSGNIHVVHGTADTAFCPHQERWNSIEGVNLHFLPDNHVFFKRTSQRLLADILTHLVPNATQSEVPPGWSPHE